MPKIHTHNKFDQLEYNNRKTFYYCAGMPNISSFFFLCVCFVTYSISMWSVIDFSSTLNQDKTFFHCALIYFCLLSFRIIMIIIINFIMNEWPRAWPILHILGNWIENSSSSYLHTHKFNLFLFKLKFPKIIMWLSSSSSWTIKLIINEKCFAIVVDVPTWHLGHKVNFFFINNFSFFELFLLFSAFF